MTSDRLVERLSAAGCVHAGEEAALLRDAARTTEELDEMVARRVAGEPLEHVVGWAEFQGLRVVVQEGVFVPRPRSALLVDEAASAVRCSAGPGRPVTLVELCCGAGAISAAIASRVPVADVDLHAADLDPRAAACARTNLARWGARVHVGDLFDALPRRLRRRIDVLVASPPYVPTREIRLLPAEARDHEPHVALDGGEDGLEVVRRIARGARAWLSPAGVVALETAPRQVDDAGRLFERLGYATRAVSSPEDGAAVVIGHRPH
jgi:release factor glutamine methyltransferase